MLLLAGAALAAATLARAAQPDAAAPVPAPMRNLTWGQLNFLHTTDTHGWLAGHLSEPQYSADWGDYISFASHLRAQAASRGADVLLVDTGDRVEGNGLYDGSDPKGRYSSEIFRQAPVDIICTGNHELYHAPTARREHEVVAGRDFADRYLASNLDYLDPDTGRRVPQARQRFRRFTTPNQGIEVLAFGFIFDFSMNANNTVVQPVAEAVAEPWFEEQIKEKPDVIVVIGHVGLRMDEFRTVYAAIRKLDWDTPVLFFGGHAHVRDAVSYDSRSFAMASGRYLETVGWMSVDGIQKKAGAGAVDAGGSPSSSSSAGPTFSRRYIDNNLWGYHHHTGLNATTFPTKRGAEVSAMIARARADLALDKRYGCVPASLWVRRAPYPAPDSVYSWIADRVVPDMCVRPDRADVPRVVIVNTGGVRFDVFEGPFTKDNALIVLPFESAFRYIPDVPYEMAVKVVPILNGLEKILTSSSAAAAGLPDIRLLGQPEGRYPAPAAPLADADADTLLPEETPDAPSHADHPRLELRSGSGRLSALGSSSSSSSPPLVAGYTTHDDIGDDGDDTVHAPVRVFPIPNVVQSDVAFPSSADGKEQHPEKVDLVFIDFIQPWIAPALRMAGGDFSDANVEVSTTHTHTHT
jgi:hypothetical protein